MDARRGIVTQGLKVCIALILLALHFSNLCLFGTAFTDEMSHCDESEFFDEVIHSLRGNPCSLPDLTNQKQNSI